MISANWKSYCKKSVWHSFFDSQCSKANMNVLISVEIHTYCIKTLQFTTGCLHEHIPTSDENLCTHNNCRHMWPDQSMSIRFSVNLLLGDLDECLWRAIEEQQLSEQLLLHSQLTALAYQVDVKTQLQQEVGRRQLDKHDTERQAFQPHADEAADDEHEWDVQTNHPTWQNTDHISHWLTDGTTVLHPTRQKIGFWLRFYILLGTK